MQTLQEKHLVIMNAIVGYGLWPEDCYFPFAADGSPSADPNGYRNFELLKREVNALDKDEDFEIEDARKLFLRLRDNGNNVRQTLIRKTAVVVQQVQQVAPPPVDPATTLPHEDIPELKTIRNLTDVIRVKNLPKEKLMRFANLKVGSPSFKEFNERIQYIADHRIGDGDAPTYVEKENVTSTKSAPTARALVDALTVRDIGSTTSAIGNGRWSQLAAAKTKLNQYINSLVQKRVDETKIIELVTAEIKKLGDSGIR